VANLSFGGHGGAHDGTAVVERYIDQLVGPNKPGKAIVTVAGNDGENDIHALVQASAGGGEMDVLIPTYSAQAGSDNDYVQIDGWYSGAKKVAITIISPGGTSYGPVSAGQYIDKRGTEGSVYVWNGFYEEKEGYVSGTNPFNGDREFYIEIGDAAGAAAPRQGTWQILLKGDATDVHSWISSTSLNGRFTVGRNSNYKISIPGTSKNGICVAAYTTKEVWDDMDGHHLTIDTKGTIQINAITAFSSPGPARYSSPRKPDLAAPGQIIGSTFSQDALPNNGSSIFVSGTSEYPNAFILGDRLHALSSGTSMAAPHVAGVIALILQKHPQISAGQIRNVLTATAQLNSGDEVTRWGWGRVDAFAALQADPAQESASALNWLEAYPNPFSDRTRIEFELPIDRQGLNTVRIRLVNILGQHVKWLLDEQRTAGWYSLYWDGRDDLGYRVASGVYLVEFEYGGERMLHKVTLLSAP
jgi:subtilisin family serine protease